MPFLYALVPWLIVLFLTLITQSAIAQDDTAIAPLPESGELLNYIVYSAIVPGLVWGGKALAKHFSDSSGKVTEMQEKFASQLADDRDKLIAILAGKDAEIDNLQSLLKGCEKSEVALTEANKYLRTELDEAIKRMKRKGLITDDGL